MDFLIRPAGETDFAAITAIYNHAVLHTTAIWNDETVGIENRRAWAEARAKLGYPVLVADRGGETVGYGSFGDFRNFHGYRFTVEHSIYVAEAARRGGVASALLSALIGEACRLGKHALIAGIAADNPPSIALHQRFGFVETARMPQVGFKFDRWLDLVFMQKILPAAIS